MTRKPFEIRPATPDDEAGMVDLQQASALHHATIDPERWRPTSREEEVASRRHWHAVEPRDAAIVAVSDGRPIGMIELWLRRPKGPPGARIPVVRVDFGIAVAQEWRGRGVGTALLRAAESWGADHGADRMSMDLDAANEGARRLYERLGYTVHGLEMDKPIRARPGTSDAPDVVRNADGELVPTLSGEAVVLRGIRHADRDALLSVLSDPTVVAVWDTRGPEKSTSELLAGDSHWTVWAIEVDGEFAGSIQAAENDDVDYRSAGIDIFMASRFQGRGLGTDAVRTLARYLIRERGHHRLTIDPAADNARAIRTYEKIGFKPVGVMRKYERGRDGTYHDGLLMDMLADELR